MRARSQLLNQLWVDLWMCARDDGAPHPAFSNSDLGLKVAQPLRAAVAEPAVPIAYPPSRLLVRLMRQPSLSSPLSRRQPSLRKLVLVDPSDHSSAPLDPGAQPSPFWRLASRRASASRARNRPRRAAHSIGWRPSAMHWRSGAPTRPRRAAVGLLATVLDGRWQQRHG